MSHVHQGPPVSLSLRRRRRRVVHDATKEWSVDRGRCMGALWAETDDIRGEVRMMSRRLGSCNDTCRSGVASVRRCLTTLLLIALTAQSEQHKCTRRMPWFCSPSDAFVDESAPAETRAEIAEASGNPLVKRRLAGPAGVMAEDVHGLGLPGRLSEGDAPICAAWDCSDDWVRARFD